MKCVSEFQNLYRRDPDGVSFCPYRVCPIGAHSDHQLGKITGLAVDQGIHMAYGKKTTGIVDIRSLNFISRAQWHVNSVPEECQHY
jgi:galactokinase/galacturonokinase